jgi:2-desacetyl-2-hydroxyethyl bacteriochlorophyllide A dehydrogenase
MHVRQTVGKDGQTMRAAVIDAPHSVVVRDVPDPTPDTGEVVIEVAGCGICGTDVHLVEGVLPGTQYPLVPGHEFYGRVVATAADGTGPTAGTLVAVDPNLPCGVCGPCVVGRSNLCENYSAIGVTRAGACAEYVAAPAAVCRVLPEDFRLDAAALIEPMSCVIHGIDRMPAQPRSARWLVYGAGTVGTLMADAVSAHTDHKVCVVEPNADRRARANTLGFRATASADELDVAAFDAVVDCTGVPAAISDALGHVATGGAVLLFGVASPGATVALSPYDVYRREITIVGSMAVHQSFDRAITAIAARPTVAAALVTHRIPLADYPDALEIFRSGVSGKVEIVPPA